MIDIFTILPADKIEHILGGAVMTFTLGLLLPTLYAIPIALTISILICAWKEWVYDAGRPATHTVDVNDFYAGVAGSLFATTVLLISKLI